VCLNINVLNLIKSKLETRGKFLQCNLLLLHVNGTVSSDTVARERLLVFDQKINFFNDLFPKILAKSEISLFNLIYQSIT